MVVAPDTQRKTGGAEGDEEGAITERLNHVWNRIPKLWNWPRALPPLTVRMNSLEGSIGSAPTLAPQRHDEIFHSYPHLSVVLLVEIYLWFLPWPPVIVKTGRINPRHLRHWGSSSIFLSVHTKPSVTTEIYRNCLLQGLHQAL
jgi:hypothetical protein